MADSHRVVIIATDALAATTGAQRDNNDVTRSCEAVV